MSPTRRRTDATPAEGIAFRKVAVLLHPHRKVVGDLERSLLPALRYLVERAEVRLDKSFKTTAATRAEIRKMGVKLGPRQEIIPPADLVVTYGGDGSLIAAASEMERPDACLIGINAGNLGFLTEGGLGEGLDLLKEVLEGRGWLDRRMKLQATVRRKKRKVATWEAINDVVIRQGRINSLLALEARVDDVDVITYRADGVIAATPSGSTAYALAVGGPIVHPSLECIQLSPIAPFTLSARSILIPTAGVVSLTVLSEHHDATITFDGQKSFDLATGDRIEIRAADDPVNFVRVKRDEYYRVLREKLGWHQLRR